MSRHHARTVAVFGLPISNLTMSEAVEQIGRSIESGKTAGKLYQVATANLDFARNARKDGFLHQIICDCDMVLPDGAPMLWASRLFGNPLKQRVTGVDLIPELAKLSAERGYGIFLLGSSEANAQAAAEALEAMHPGVRIVGRHSPAISSLANMDDFEILRQIHQAKPEILLVAFGNPKQEIWIHRNRHKLNVPVAVGIGGSLDMIAGNVRRAPQWIQKFQMEWVFRMVQEPQRLAPRYARDFVALMRHLPVELAVNWMQPGKVSQWPMEVAQEGDSYLLRLPEIVTGDVCASVILQSNLAILKRRTVIVDMSLTTRVEADGLGCLLEARRMISGAGLGFWLAAVSPRVLRVLEASSLVGLFRIAESPMEAVRNSVSSVGNTAERGHLLHMAPGGGQIKRQIQSHAKRASA